jgi:hypothetical protein
MVRDPARHCRKFPPSCCRFRTPPCFPLAFPRLIRRLGVCRPAQTIAPGNAFTIYLSQSLSAARFAIKIEDDFDNIDRGMLCAKN